MDMGIFFLCKKENHIKRMDTEDFYGNIRTDDG